MRLFFSLVITAFLLFIIFPPFAGLLFAGGLITMIFFFILTAFIIRLLAALFSFIAVLLLIPLAALLPLIFPALLPFAMIYGICALLFALFRKKPTQPASQ
jgi:hypothetical protein